ncbi:FliH/SctL family protein [Microbacterium sp. SORGH_AS_0421]|uniref:FliH/SctL family protein n=1 Tax=Microbacterium sp. SORGH_AS_0421 TaxID=3041768 RepID=UPI002791FED6|nr:FliH/SctL family protein [Microbacterium sp. SORGH_AS_0421]MDQ1177203.1 flagellar assembly protein FliH [Microbacterium sp. SORGH_AS_0421]
MSDSVFTPLVVPRVGDARPDAREVVDRARARGYADGFAAGRRDARAELERERIADERRIAARDAAADAAHRAALSALGEAKARLDAEVGALVASDVRRLEELAVEMAAEILRTEMSDAARSAAHAMRRAAAQTPRAAWVRVHLNERDLRTLRDAAAAELAEGVEVVADADVDPGGAIVRIAHGSVDTRIGAAFERARAELALDDDGEAGS